MTVAVRWVPPADETGRICPHRRVSDLRRLLLPKTRYHVFHVYRADRAEVLLLAVWSAVRGRGPRLEPPHG